MKDGQGGGGFKSQWELLFFIQKMALHVVFLPKIGKTPADFKRNVSMYQILVNRYNQSVKNMKLLLIHYKIKYFGKSVFIVM